jgi:chemotaxis protein methyltransferase CheR
VSIIAEAVFDKSPDDSGYERIRTWLNARCGIYYAEKKKELLSQRLARVLERFGLSDLEELADCVETGQKGDVEQAVVDVASTNHTYFFREPQVLDYFSNTILPNLAHKPALHIWSAAASTGDEAYTLAILAAEIMGPEQAASRVSILGTDISAPVIKRAEAAVYGAAHLEHAPEYLLQRYFEPAEAGDLRVVPHIQRMCTFRRLNLKARPFPFHRPFDVVCCRNVLYYFDRVNQRRTLEALFDVTERGGWLLTSVTESVRDLGTRWCWVGGGIYRKLA